jgi:hypothetical protein
VDGKSRPAGVRSQATKAGRQYLDHRSATKNLFASRWDPGRPALIDLSIFLLFRIAGACLRDPGKLNSPICTAFALYGAYASFI